MAEYQSTEYSRRANPQTGVSTRMLGGFQPYEFTWASAAAGTAGDTILLRVLKPGAVVFMISSYFEWATFTSGATISIGWQAYTDVDGATQALSAAGLISAVSLTTDSVWAHGMLLTATPDDSKPVVNKKAFNNRSEVVLYATIGSQAPGATATLSGVFMVAHS